MAAEREEKFDVRRKPDKPQGADYGLESSEVKVSGPVKGGVFTGRTAVGGAVLGAAMFMILPRAAADDLVVVNGDEVGVIEGAEGASGETPYASTVDVGGEGRSVVVHDSDVASVGVPSSGQIKTVDLSDPDSLAVAGTKPVSALGTLAPRAGDDLMWVPFGAQLGVGNPDNPEIETVSGGGPFPSVTSVLNSSNERIVLTSVGDSGTQFCILKETSQGSDEYEEVLILDLAEIVAELGPENFHFDPRGFASVVVSDGALVLQIGGVGGGVMASFPFNPDSVDPTNPEGSFDKSAGEIIAVNEFSTFNHVVMSDHYQVGLDSTIVLVDPLTGQTRVLDVFPNGGAARSYVFDQESQLLYVSAGPDVYVIDLSSPDIDDVVSDNTGGNLQVINTAAFGDISALGLRKTTPEGDDDDDDDAPGGPPDGFDEEDEVGDSEIYADSSPEIEITESPTGLDIEITEMPESGDSIWATFATGPAASHSNTSTLSAEDAVSFENIDLVTEGTELDLEIRNVDGTFHVSISLDNDQFPDTSTGHISGTVFVNGEPQTIDFNIVEGGADAEFVLGTEADFNMGGDIEQPGDDDDSTDNNGGETGCSQVSVRLPGGGSMVLNLAGVLMLLGVASRRRRS